MKENGWTLDQVDDTNYFDLCELYEKNKQNMIPLAEFMKKIPTSKG